MSTGSAFGGSRRRRSRSVAARVVRALIEGYRLMLAPFLGGHCRFYPSCSAFAAEAVDRHGAVRGVQLAFRRILRCRPAGGSGFDPVP